MTGDELKNEFKKFHKQTMALFPDEKAKVKIIKAGEDKIKIVGNEAGIVRWGMAMTASVILKSESKPDLPGYLIIHDRLWFTKDSQLLVEEYICNDELRSDQIWFEQAHSKKAEKTKYRDMFGCFLGIAVVVFMAFCTLFTVIRWIS